jgi:hypothetical protein
VVDGLFSSVGVGLVVGVVVCAVVVGLIVRAVDDCECVLAATYTVVPSEPTTASLPPGTGVIDVGENSSCVLAETPSDATTGTAALAATTLRNWRRRFTPPPRNTGQSADWRAEHSRAYLRRCVTFEH